MKPPAQERSSLPVAEASACALLCPFTPPRSCWRTASYVRAQKLLAAVGHVEVRAVDPMVWGYRAESKVISRLPVL